MEWERPASGTPGNPTPTIYVGVADKRTSVYKSTDGGATWSEISGQPTGFIPHHGELASNGYLYITYSDDPGPYVGGKGDVWKLNTNQRLDEYQPDTEQQPGQLFRLAAFR